MKTVLLFGTFDILHIGHLNLLKQARKYGDRLIVVVGRDATVKKVKGQLPIHSEKERLELLQHIDLVDAAMLGDKTDMYKKIKEIKPDVIALGYDQEMFVDKLQDMLDKFKFKTKIVRLKAYKANTHKSGKIKQKLLQSV
jgi:FAD synthetase